MENLARVEKKYSYQDLLDMDDDNRYEIINGELYLMGAPSVIHQMVLGEIYKQIANYLSGKKCKVFVSPLDVCFSKEKDFRKIWNVLQPDISIICDQEKINKQRIVGAPDVVMEVLSPNNIPHDKLIKFNFYQKHKVKEYWIIDPIEQLIFPYVLNEKGIYTISRVYSLDECIKIEQLDNCKIDLKKFLEENKELFTNLG